MKMQGPVDESEEATVWNNEAIQSRDDLVG